ncbi:4-phosphoerythronate dehydrogenase [Halosquirtibacter laminarini]|uniref:4-phosphoerythronate dehydrogenase n=1 Tax=Halosquirtibacter laminarini TaxID=3374600 RepID=A0AC61NC52_9BACT|nr:4-phosphoerythronate dehydrogenase [Prolixibacteraceae bacterium]
MKIIIDDKIPFIQGVFEPYAKVIYVGGSDFTPQLVRDADALIIRTRTKCNRSLLEGSKVKFIATATIGFDHIDRDYCASKGIIWKNAPGCNSWSVAQYMAAVFALLFINKGVDVQGKTLGIVGVGNVGSKVAKYASALGMRVLLCDPPLEQSGSYMDFVSLKEIKEQCDIITFHVPLSMEGEHKTFHMVDEQFLNECSRTPILCNTCRGEVFSTESVLLALKEKMIEEVVIDCWEDEPAINQELLNLAFIATPHIAGYSRDGKAMGTTMSVHSMAAYFKLPLLDWSPEGIEPPVCPIIDIDVHGGRSALWNTIYHTYPIEKEVDLLKHHVATFEQQRGDYPLRREFPAYTVKTKDYPFQEVLAKLNFNLL